MDNADHQALVGHPGLIRPEHLQRLAVVYLRQSTPGQVQKHTGSTAAQRDLAMLPCSSAGLNPGST